MESRSIIEKIMSGSLVLQIVIGIVCAVALSLISPELSARVALLGDLFVKALMAVAPVLVLVLVASAIANRKVSHTSQMRPILLLYLVGTISAALLAVTMSSLFPTELVLDVSANRDAPEGIGEVLNTMLLKLVDNPINAILTGNFIGIVIWGALLGVFLHHAAESTRVGLHDLADAITKIVRLVIRLAPIGIFGLVSGTLAAQGLSGLESYGRILAVLVGSMLLMALVINPAIVWVKMRRNPYKIVFAALRESGVTAFFTRSSAANIPVNMALCEKLDLEEDTYAVSIPLGATINMGGAAITIDSKSALAKSTSMPCVCTAASVSVVIVIAAPPMLMVAPSGMDTA